MRTGRKREPRIVDPATHPRPLVCLRVAAEWLHLDVRTVRARIINGELQAVRDGKVYRVTLSALLDYDARRRGACST